MCTTPDEKGLPIVGGSVRFRGRAAVNLTDGLDGLAIGSTLVASATYAIFTYVAGQMRGVGIVFSRFLEVDVTVGVVIGMAIVFTYATLGGMKGITWTQVAKLTQPTTVAGDDFGASVDFDGTSAVVGAPGIGMLKFLGDPATVRSARTYLGLLLATSIGLFLPAIIWTSHIAGSGDFTVGGILAGKIAGADIGLLLALFVFGVGKAAVMPVHRWLPAAMVAPTPVSALLHAVAVVKAGVFGMGRIVCHVFGVDLVGTLGIGIWLGIMIAINLQTSFLTPPFGFALFYLRGVAPATVTTGQISETPSSVAFWVANCATLPDPETRQVLSSRVSSRVASISAAKYTEP